MAKILWADDEIELLKPHVLFLLEKGYEVDTVNNAQDAIERVETENYDIVFLDENMPGISGLEALTRIKARYPAVPVVMITKSEEESIMNEAIGSKISDYLIKPVNPNQILLSLKKTLDNKKLIGEKTTSNYQVEFRQIGMTLTERLDSDEWVELYRKLCFWEAELQQSQDKSMEEILNMQKAEANRLFSKFIASNYLKWISEPDEDTPLMIHNTIRQRVIPEVKEASTFLVVIDNLRYDQYKAIAPLIESYFHPESEEIIFSILPTATQYARNALFAGLMPADIQKLYPKLWVRDDEDEGKNLHEEELLSAQLKRLGSSARFSYNKITNIGAGKKLAENLQNLMQNDLNVVVYNFVDMLSHARTEMEVIRELADDSAAYRSLTVSWFEHSPLRDIMQKIAAAGKKMIVTTDHGTIHVKHPVKVVGDRNTNTNLRYKHGRNLNYNPKEVFAVTQPEKARLPKENMSSSYIFALEDSFFVYPNNYNHFVNYYKDTFQHGGISMEEMLIPFAVYTPKG